MDQMPQLLQVDCAEQVPTALKCKTQGFIKWTNIWCVYLHLGKTGSRHLDCSVMQINSRFFLNRAHLALPSKDRYRKSRHSDMKGNHISFQRFQWPEHSVLCPSQKGNRRQKERGGRETAMGSLVLSHRLTVNNSVQTQLPLCLKWEHPPYAM